MRLQNLGIARKLWLGVIFLIAANVVIVGFSGIRTAKLTASFDAAFAQLDTKLAAAQDWASRTTRPPAQVCIWLDTDPARQQMGLHVADNGPGVHEDDREHIFSAFYSTKEGGMGMGLSICRSIIEAHRGRIDVARSDELHGAQFTLWLPLNP
mgnify:CR=1 FL=1